MFHQPTSSLGWGGGIKSCNKGAMGPNRTLVYHIHIKLGHINNKYWKNKVAFLHEDTWRPMETFGDSEIPPYTCHGLTQNLKWWGMERYCKVNRCQIKFHVPKDSNVWRGLNPHGREIIWEETMCHLDRDSLCFMTTIMEDYMKKSDMIVDLIVDLL